MFRDIEGLLRIWATAGIQAGLIWGILFPSLACAAPPLPNAWQIEDSIPSYGSTLTYSFQLSPAQRDQALNNGWRLTLKTRLLNDYKSPPTMGMLCDNGSQRIALFWNFDAQGNLVSHWDRLFQTRTVLQNGDGSDAYATHELVLGPATGLRYWVNGIDTGGWPTDFHSTESMRVQWGALGHAGMGVMHVQQATFEIMGMGVVAAYDAGEQDNPSEAPDPVTQGWERLQGISPIRASAVSPDAGLLAPGARTSTSMHATPAEAVLAGSIQPHGQDTIGWFEWGTEEGPMATTPVQVLGGGPGWTNLSATLSGLPVGNMFQYRVAASNAFGITRGNLRTFSSLFADAQAPLPEAANQKVAAGDFDGDEDWDILIATGSGPKLYRNDDGVLSAIPMSGGGSSRPAVAWGDSDNDNDLDFLFLDDAPGWSSLYENIGFDQFNFTNHYFAGMQAGGDAAWGDADNDGDQDFVLAGGYPGSWTFHRNDHGMLFQERHAGLPAVGGIAGSSVDWGDYDNDGNQDILLMGYTGTSNLFGIYRNEAGHHFTDIQAGLPQVSRGMAVWGDYDGDGDLDILVSGEWDEPTGDFIGTRPLSMVFRNEGGTNFVDINAGLPGLNYALASWADFDSDGDLDILLAGATGSWFQSQAHSFLFRNDGGTNFVDINAGLPQWYGGSASWMDFDHDGDQDLLVTGNGLAGGPVTRMYLNQGGRSNAPPLAPIGLQSSQHAAHELLLEWNPGDDTETPREALSYNLRMGLNSNDVSIISPQADLSSGFRRLSGPGNAGQGTSWILQDPPLNQALYWSLQTIDSLGVGSPFAPIHYHPPIHPNAWEIRDLSSELSGSLTYSTNLTAEQRAATSAEGWRFSVEARFVDALNSRPTLSMVFGDGSRRYAVDWTLDSQGDLVAILNGASHTVTTAGAGADSFHTHAMLTHPIQGVSYWFNGVFISTIQGEITSAQAGQIAWGARDDEGKGIMQFHRVRFELIESGVITSYEAGTEGFPQGTPDPEEQGWTRVPTVLSDSVSAGPAQTDARLQAPGVNTLDTHSTDANSSVLSGRVDPHRYETFAWFEWGTDTNYGQTTPVQGMSSGWGWFPVEFELGDLGFEQTYHYRLVASNEFGIRLGADVLFKTRRHKLLVTALPGVHGGDAVWGDYDGDGRLDLAISGWRNGVPAARIYRNLGNYVFEEIQAGLPGVVLSGVAWSDYDGDGDLDLLLLGSTWPGQITRLYRNDGTNQFTDTGIVLPGVSNGFGIWGDYDNDGDPDLLLSGYTGSGRLTSLFRNEGGTNFVDINAGLPGLSGSAAAWGDYDTDGDLDMVISGSTGPARWTSIYRNDGALGFVDIQAGLIALSGSSVAWGDYDSDGDPDLLLHGHDGTAPMTRIYRNEGAGQFADIMGTFIGSHNGSVTWGDADQDGDLDVLITGQTSAGRISAIYRNDGNDQFVVMDEGWIGLQEGVGVWGDIDNDHDLDILLLGFDGATSQTLLLETDDPSTNSLPTAPSLLGVDVEQNTITFHWEGAQDAQTPASALTYQLHVQPMMGKGTLEVAADGTPGSFRSVVAPGDAHHNHSWSVRDLPPGPIAWSVQAVDASWQGGPYAPLQTLLPLKLEVQKVAEGVHLTIRGSASTAFRVEATEDMLTWSGIGALATDTNGVAEFLDEVAPMPVARFYRLATP